MAKKKQPLIAHVEDRAANRYLVQKILTDAGFDIVQAETGTEGLEVVRATKPDLVILDVRLPDISGFEVCRRLKADPETQSISVLQISSQLTNVDSRVQGLDSGADAYLTAIRPAEIVATVKALLRAKEAEEMALAKAAEWSATFNAVKDPILLINTAGAILQTNKSADILIDSLTQSEIDLLTRDFVQTLQMQGELADSAESIEVAVQNRVFRMSLARLSESSSDPEERYVAVLTDITTLVHAEAVIRRSNETLMVARDAAVTASRAKSAFMSSMSHEFRTPLNAILGYAELMHELAMERGDDMASKDLSRIITSARHLLNLISDVLDIAKIEAGKASLNISTFDVKQLVNDVVATLQPMAKNQQTTIIVTADETPAELTSDSTKLRQILLNLVGNACKFTAHGKITVSINEAASGDGDQLNLQVTDTGIGISPEKLSVIFDAFEQGEHTQGPFGGTGLGLAISKRLAELLGGSLIAESELNVGSTFTLKLPVNQFQRAPEAKLPG